MVDTHPRQIVHVPVTRLRFDPENPRLPRSLAAGASESDVLEWMLSDTSLTDLIGSIAAQGYFEGEPLLAVRVPDDPDEFLIIEGNRRLAALKLLTDPRLAPIRKKAVANIVDEARPSKFNEVHRGVSAWMLLRIGPVIKVGDICDEGVSHGRKVCARDTPSVITLLGERSRKVIPLEEAVESCGDALPCPQKAAHQRFEGPVGFPGR